MSTEVMYAQYCDISVCHQSLSLAIVFTKIRSLCIVKLFPLFSHKVYFISYSLHRCFRVYLEKQQTCHKQQIKIHFEKIIECVFSKPRQFQIDIQITFLKSFSIYWSKFALHFLGHYLPQSKFNSFWIMKNIFRVLTMNGYMIEDKIIL